MYVYFNNNPKEKNTGDCVIRAVSKALGVSWLQAYMDLYVLGMQLGDLANSDAVWTAYLKSKGFKKRIVPDTCPDCYTVGQFATDHDEGVYVLGTGTHAVTVISGDVYDAWDSRNETPIFYMEREW